VPRAARRFRTYDTDGDGYIGRADFEQAAIRMAKEFGHGPLSAARQRFVGLLAGLWAQLATVAGVDADGKISEPRFPIST
jgi:hypothetical protein